MNDKNRRNLESGQRCRQWIIRIALVILVGLSVSTVSLAQGKAVAKPVLHAVLVTYENDRPANQLRTHPDNIAFAKGLKKVRGLISKTWINDEKTFGGFYVFAGKASADAFINGEMFQGGVVKDPSNRNVQVRHFDVFSELTLMTGGSSKPLSGKQGVWLLGSNRRSKGRFSHERQSISSAQFPINILKLPKVKIESHQRLRRIRRQ